MSTKKTESTRRTDDIVEIQQLLARYAVTITQGDVDGLIGVFTPTAPTARSVKPIRWRAFRCWSMPRPRGCS